MMLLGFVWMEMIFFIKVRFFCVGCLVFLSLFIIGFFKIKGCKYFLFLGLLNIYLVFFLIVYRVNFVFWI